MKKNNDILDDQDINQPKKKRRWWIKRDRAYYIKALIFSPFVVAILVLSYLIPTWLGLSPNTLLFDLTAFSLAMVMIIGGIILVMRFVSPDKFYSAKVKDYEKRK